MLEPRTPPRPPQAFRISRTDLAQASAWSRLLLIAPVLALVWLVLIILVQA